MARMPSSGTTSINNVAIARNSGSAIRSVTPGAAAMPEKLRRELRELGLM